MATDLIQFDLKCSHFHFESFRHYTGWSPNDESDVRCLMVVNLEKIAKAFVQTP